MSKHAIRQMIFDSPECRTQKLKRHAPRDPMTTSMGSQLRQAALAHARRK